MWLPDLLGSALGSLLLGLPFTAITLFAMQEARRLRLHNTSATIGMPTAAYGLGQIAGPPLVAWLLHLSVNPGRGFEVSLLIAGREKAIKLGGFGYLPPPGLMPGCVAMLPHVRDGMGRSMDVLYPWP